MSPSLHPAASHHLPSFITAPGETDVFMVAMAVVLVVTVLMFGVLFLTLHTLPERMAHKSHKLQFEIVAVLGLLALFTHMHIFWVAGLLLALIDIPDIGGWLGRIAGSVEKIAENGSDVRSSDRLGERRDEAGPAIKLSDQPAANLPESIAIVRRADDGASTRRELAPAD